MRFPIRFDYALPGRRGLSKAALRTHGRAGYFKVLDLHDLLFLGGDDGVNILDKTVGQLLNLILQIL